MSIREAKMDKLRETISLSLGEGLEYKKDGKWSNFVSGVGTYKDKDYHNKFQVTNSLETDDPQVSDSLCRSDRLAYKICNTPAKDAIKNGYTIASDDNDYIKRQVDNLKFDNVIEKAVTDSRKFGGSAVLICCSDSNLEKPLDKKTQIQQLINYTSIDIMLEDIDFCTDFGSEYFNDYEFFHVKRRDAEPLKIHRSRFLVFKGRISGTVTNATNLPKDRLYWGDSELGGIYESIGRYGIALSCAGTALQELNVSVLGLEGLGELVSSMACEDPSEKDEAMAKLQSRLEAMAMTKSLVNMVVIDAENEKYTNKAVVIAGISEVISTLQMDLSGKTDIPITKLFGRSPSGENSTGESDNANYNSMCIDIQVDIKPLLQKIISLLTGDFNGTKHVVEFKHPDPPTEKEKVEIEKVRMDVLTGYMKESILEPEQLETYILKHLGIEIG